MSISINPAHARCSKRDTFVSLEQTEGQCRDKHYCSDDACPLEGEFGQNRFQPGAEPACRQLRPEP